MHKLRTILTGALMVCASLSIAHRPAGAAVSVLLSEPFSGSSTADSYRFSGGTCLTAGTGSGGSVPACGSTAHLDHVGSGVLQLNEPVTEHGGFIVSNSTFPTANGLIITFTDYSYQGSNPGGDGIVMFLTDASLPEPTGPGQFGPSLGYGNSATGSGLAAAYVGVGLDQYGDFSSPHFGHTGGPGRVSETVAVRGAARTNWQYLTGYENKAGYAASLPFHIDDPLASTHLPTAPTFQISLSASGLFSVAIDRHDGKGMNYYLPPTTIVGRSGQPVVPAAVRLGFVGSSYLATSRHQIGSLKVTTIGASGVGGGGGSPQDNLTYHSNNMRTGWYQNEKTLTAANVGSSAFHRVGTLSTAGKSYSQPLYVSAQKIYDGSTHNLLLVTDSTDVVYAYDADTLALLWKRDFKNSAAGIRQQFASDIGCDDTWPNVGINGTPVVDRSRNFMYLVVPTKEPSGFHLRLHAISLENGGDGIPAVEVTGTDGLYSGGTASVDPAYNFNRAGLLETDNTIYVPLSTHCDFDSNSAHGWLIAYNASTLAQTGTLVDTTRKDIGTTQGARFLGSIWQGGFAIAADGSSNIFFATGNGPNDDGGSDFGMSVLGLPPNLDIGAGTFFTPSGWERSSLGDADLGSGGVMLLPDQAKGVAHLAIAGGKTGIKYLLDRDNLGGLHATDQVLWEANTGGRQWGGPAYFVDSFGNQKILYGGTPSLDAFTLKPAPDYDLSLTSNTTVGVMETRNFGVTPVVSSNGTVSGSAVVWAIATANSESGAVPITLYAFNGADLAQTLFAAQAGVWTSDGDTGGALITPLVANGRVYLATDGEVTVYGIH
jgi:hypothetical protein